jgi:DNA-binding response OmpR family regulator
MKIIIIEKKIHLAQKIQMDIKKLNYQIDHFKHGFFATQAMKKKNYSLAIINEKIGVESGFMIARCLRKINPELKVIIYSKKKFDFYKKIKAFKENYFTLEGKQKTPSVIDCFSNPRFINMLF